MELFNMELDLDLSAAKSKEQKAYEKAMRQYERSLRRNGKNPNVPVEAHPAKPANAIR